LINYGRHDIDEEDISAVVKVLRSDFVTQGPVVAQFESAIAERVGAKHAIAVSNGTAGLHLACMVAGADQNSRGVTSTLSFVASANCLIHAGAEADLIDIDPATLNLSAKHLKRHLDQNEAEIVIPVHFAGLATDNAAIKEVSGSRCIIEDACHALGGTYEDGSPIGSGKYADMSVFSFHPVKPITSGEGGMVVTNNDEYARRLRLIRNHGIERDEARFSSTEGLTKESLPWYYEQQALGFNYRLNDIQAALGLSQLGKLDKFLSRRQEISLHYDQAFSDLPIEIPHSNPKYRSRSGLHLYLIHVDWKKIGTNRADFMRYLAGNNINTQVHYIPIHRQPYHVERYGYEPQDFAAAEHYYYGCMTLPLFPAMTDEDVELVVKVVKSEFEI
jgi:UDP-4-amino-4,6-dideoxy-N-acetyl-beta-L-altrosamine transaminase